MESATTSRFTLLRGHLHKGLATAGVSRGVGLQALTLRGEEVMYWSYTRANR